MNLLFSLLFSLLTLPLSAGYFYPYETPIVKYLKPIEIVEEHSGLDMIDCMYVINLDRRPEKWQRLRALFNQRGLHPNRVAAVDGWQIPMAVQRQLAGPYPVRVAPGHLGCLLSHVSVIKDAYDRGFDCIWVFEDDVEFHADAATIPGVLEELASIDPAWDIFYTDPDSFIRSGGCDFRPDQPHSRPSFYKKRTIMNKNFMKAGVRFGAYSMIISRRGIEKLINYFTHVYVWCNYDWDIHYVPGIREYSYRTKLVTVPPSNDSDTAFHNE
jgi:GR25 family glycosyltransferase involved in LPS biosynthesis